jgi:ABC-type lipoprotein release transport system permease subunit
MFDFDSFREIISTIKKNKLRTFLTGLAVAWGIFMLIVLLGFANGFRNATMTNFSDRANNTISVNPGWTSKPYQGTPSNKEIKLDYRDYDLIRSKIKDVEYLSPQISKSGTIAYEKQFGSWNMTGVSPDFASIMNVKIKGGNGRFINEIDMEEMRKVIVINSDMKKVLFKEEIQQNRISSNRRLRPQKPVQQRPASIHTLFDSSINLQTRRKFRPDWIHGKRSDYRRSKRGIRKNIAQKNSSYTPV